MSPSGRGSGVRLRAEKKAGEADLPADPPAPQVVDLDSLVWPPVLFTDGQTESQRGAEGIRNRSELSSMAPDSSKPRDLECPGSTLNWILPRLALELLLMPCK